MSIIQERKIGTSLDNDSNILFKTGKLVADIYTKPEKVTRKYKKSSKEYDVYELGTEKVDIGKLVSTDLSDMFGVFEFECYYPKQHTVRVLKSIILQLSEPFSIRELIKLQKHGVFIDSSVIWKKVFELIISFLRMRLSDTNSVNLNRVFAIIEKQFKTDDWRSSLIISNFNMLETVLYDENVRISLIDDKFKKEEKILTFKNLIDKFSLELNSEEFAVSPDQKFIGEYVNDNYSFISIKESLEKEFKGSLFEGDRIEIQLSKEQDAKLNGAAWNLTEDGSLTDRFSDHIPVEIVSKRIPFSQMSKALQFMNSLFDRLDIKTTVKTGLHLNIGFNSPRNIDLLKVVVLTADDYELKLFDRADNKYCHSQITSLVENTRFSRINENASKTLWEQVKIFNKENVFPIIKTDEKYAAINFKKWITPFTKLKPVLEFRIMGGKDYLKDVAKIIHRSNRFFYIVSVSGNPELYKREYLNRLERISKKSDNDYDKESEAYWEKESLENAFTTLLSNVKRWNKYNSFDDFYVENEFNNSIMNIIQSTTTKIDFNLFRNFLVPLRNEILKSKTLTSYLNDIFKNLKKEGSQEDLKMFKRYFFKVVK